MAKHTEFKLQFIRKRKKETNKAMSSSLKHGGRNNPAGILLLPMLYIVTMLISLWSRAFSRHVVMVAKAFSCSPQSVVKNSAQEMVRKDGLAWFMVVI